MPDYDAMKAKAKGLFRMAKSPVCNVPGCQEKANRTVLNPRKDDGEFIGFVCVTHSATDLRRAMGVWGEEDGEGWAG